MISKYMIDEYEIKLIKSIDKVKNIMYKLNRLIGN